MSFGQLLKTARKRQEKTLKEVSQVARLSLSYISDMEQERRKAPSLEVVEKIEEFLELKDGSLVKAAQAEMNMQLEVRTIFRKRPDLNMQLLRAADYCSEEDLTEMINVMKKKGHPNDVP